jgi:hypothetical protein
VHGTAGGGKQRLVGHGRAAGPHGGREVLVREGRRGGAGEVQWVARELARGL